MYPIHMQQVLDPKCFYFTRKKKLKWYLCWPSEIKEEELSEDRGEQTG